jgi:hypothetical protein
VTRRLRRAVVDDAHPGADDSARVFYIEALVQLGRTTIPFLVGGAFAFARYVHIDRETKDLDIFIRPEDVRQALALFRGLGYRADLPFPHWLAKVRCGDFFLDLIFSSGNGVARVDDHWFDNPVEREVLGLRLRLCPPEEMIWSKAFVQERERFDGADVLHLLRQLGPSLDWQRLLARFGPHWRVLFSHIVLFGFVYPGPASPHPGVGARRADEAVRRRGLGAGDARVQRDPAVPRAVLVRRHTPWLRRREDRTDGKNDSRGSRHLDGVDRRRAIRGREGFCESCKTPPDPLINTRREETHD